MWRELLVAIALAASNVVIHALGTYGLLRWLIRLEKKRRFAAFTRAAWTTLWLVAALVFLHSVEAVVWARFYIFQHCFADRETAYYYSLTNTPRSAMAT